AINRALSAIDGIKRGETIAITPNKPGGAQRLVGFVQQEREVVPDTSEVTDVTELLTHLSPTLPGYMLPGVLLSVTEWPLTRTGKVDRNTLQAWYEQWLLEHQLNTRSLTPTERQITKVWESVLGCKTLNHSAHFYQLGGNSLLALKAVSQLASIFKLNIGILDVLKRPVLSQLASHIQQMQQQDLIKAAEFYIQPITNAVKSHGVGISIQQLSLWPLYQMGQAAHYNIPVCYALPVEVNTERLCQALIQVYQQHDALHSIFVDNGEQVLLRPRIDTNWQAQVELISPDSLETTVIKAYQQEQARQFDLVNDTLFVARLLDAGEQRFILLNFPHIIMDGWSIGQLWQKVNHYYVGDNTQT
ncbi:condensation domain-containing protein, partial [Shewanella denitrificans]